MAAVVAETITTVAVCASFQACDMCWVDAPKIHDIYCSMRPLAYQYAVGCDLRWPFGIYLPADLTPPDDQNAPCSYSPWHLSRAAESASMSAKSMTPSQTQRARRSVQLRLRSNGWLGKQGRQAFRWAAHI